MFLQTILIVIAFVFFSGVRIIRPTQRGLVERLGKYNRFATTIYDKIY